MMEQQYAIITQGVVSLVIVADQAFADEHYPGAVRIDLLTPLPGVGWTYSSGAFTAPAIIPPDPPEPVHKTVFTRFEFRQLFTLQELLLLDNYQLSEILTPEQKALMTVSKGNFDSADTIDVTDPVAIQGVSYLAVVGILTPERVAEILAT